MQYNLTFRERYGKIQFIISHKDQGGQWRQKSRQGFAKKSLAKKAAELLLDELKEAHALQLSSELEGITFGEFMEMHLEHIKLYKEPNTVRSYEQTVKKFAALKPLPLDKIRPLHVQGCVDEMVRCGLRVSSVKAHTTRLKTLLKSAVSPYRIISKNPVTDIKLPQVKRAAKRRALTLGELRGLLSGIASRKKYVITLLAAKCGLRLGEIYGLTWGDVEGSNVSVNKQWKRDKRGTWGFGELKSRASYRTVPAPDSVIRALREYKKISPASIDRRIFPYAQTTGADLAATYRKLGYDVSVHDLRHTFASLLIAGGMDFRTAAQLLGHTPEETVRTYSHVTSDMMEKAARVMNDVFE